MGLSLIHIWYFSIDDWCLGDYQKIVIWVYLLGTLEKPFIKIGNSWEDKEKMQNNKKKYLGRGIGSVLACIVVSVLLSVGSLYFATDKYGIRCV